MELIINVVENSRINTITRLVDLDIKRYNHRGNQNLYRIYFNVIVRLIYLFP